MLSVADRQIIPITHHMTVEWEGSPTAANGKGAVIACSIDTESFETAYLVLPAGARAPVWIDQKFLMHSRVAGH